MWTPSFLKRAKRLTGKPSPIKLRIDHCLKTYPTPFCAIRDGLKKFEVRWDDRGFEVGQAIKLDEYDGSVNRYTHRFVVVAVSYILRGPAYGLPEGLVVMSVDLTGVTESTIPDSIELEVTPGAYGK